MMHIEQADFVTRHLIGFHAGDHGGIDTVARIANADAYPIAALVNANRHHAFAFTGLNTVNNGTSTSGWIARLGITQLHRRQYRR